MAYLVLSTGDVFEGKRMGALNDACGELVFTTETEYMKTLSREENAGKLVVSAFPIVGNHGIIKDEEIGDNAPLGFVVRERLRIRYARSRRGVSCDSFRGCGCHVHRWCRSGNYPAFLCRILLDEGTFYE